MNVGIQINSDPQQNQSAYVNVVVNYQPWVPGNDGWSFVGGSNITVADIAPDTWQWFIDPHFSWEAIGLRGHPSNSDNDPEDVFWLKMPGSQCTPADLKVGDSGDVSIFGTYACATVLGNSPTWTVQSIA